jgi:RecB family endonuclease NucS
MAIEIDFTEKDIEDYLCKSGNLMKHLCLRFVARQVDIFGFCIDILGYNEIEESFYIIELKKGNLDTKAFTQIYKYYRLLNIKYNSRKNKYHNFKMLLIGQHLSSELVGVLNNYSIYN